MPVLEGWPLPAGPLPRAAGRAARNGKLQREEKRAALSRLALQPNPAAHERHQALGNGQPQARAAVTPRRRGVGLREGRKDSFLVLGCDADAGVGNREFKCRRADEGEGAESRR